MNLSSVSQNDDEVWIESFGSNVVLHAYYEQVHVPVKTGFGLVIGLFESWGILTTLVLSSLHPQEIWKFMVLFSTVYVRTCSLKGITWEY